MRFRHGSARIEADKAAERVSGFRFGRLSPHARRFVAKVPEEQ
jgi:hypothetical protein